MWTHRLNKTALTTLTVLLPTFAQASQGPGVGAGTASDGLQLAMAIVVYGGAALTMAAGLFGAVRQMR